MKASVESIIYLDHAIHKDCEDLNRMYEGDTLIQTIGAVIRETDSRLYVCSDVALSRDYVGAPLEMLDCRVDEILKSTIVNRKKIGAIELNGIEEWRE